MTKTLVGVFGASAVGVMLATVGCTTNVVKSGSGTGSDAGGPACAARAGNYVVTAAVQDGTCGPLRDSTFKVEECTQTFCFAYENANLAGETTTLESRVAGCVGTVTVTADNCTAEYSYNCKSASANVDHNQKVGKIVWSADGTSANGTDQFSLFSSTGKSLCTSNYTITIAKQ
jgi:hypothetical protein